MRRRQLEALQELEGTSVAMPEACWILLRWFAGNRSDARSLICGLVAAVRDSRGCEG